MIPIDTIVSIKSGDEYGGKYTGKLGIIKKFTDDRVGVEFAGLKNHASKYGLFWFKKENVTPSLFDVPKRNDAIIPAALAKAYYEVLANMYKSRRNHKLDEWHTLCDWIESLPYSKLITGGVVDE